ncbi:hypothetical protein F5Y11DRAFT_344395 [Daldinia sp. FL1419]|nr:hypothetical protein F5Y11DRAFT_344395 [Daldinia sp. FL1419]
MRSRPYTPPPPLPPLLNELSAFLPNSGPRNSDDDKTIALPDLDPETSRLLPVQERPRHCVRIQGRLAPVRSVSVANLRSASQPRFDTAVGGTTARPRRRQSSDDLNYEAGSEVKERDAQLRSYGIGGRGNIREFPALSKQILPNANTHSRQANRCHRNSVRNILIRAFALFKHWLGDIPLPFRVQFR